MTARVHQIDEILTLAERYARARKIAPATLGHRAMRSSTWVERCARGRVTLASAAAFVQWLSDHWPLWLEWPKPIERPAPAPDAPCHREGDSNTHTDPMRLAPSGEIASPRALCDALGVHRSVYYAVVRRYGGEGLGKRPPRPGSESARVLTALIKAGDRRFAARGTRTAA